MSEAGGSEARVFTIDGMRFAVCGNYLYTHLYKPFLSAGKRFNWNPRVPGLGLNAGVLRFASTHNLKIRVFIGERVDRCYEGDPAAWSQGEQYVLNGVSLRILPWNSKFFETVKDFDRNVLKSLRGG